MFTAIRSSDMEVSRRVIKYDENYRNTLISRYLLSLIGATSEKSREKVRRGLEARFSGDTEPWTYGALIQKYKPPHLAYFFDE